VITRRNEHIDDPLKRAKSPGGSMKTLISRLILGTATFLLIAGCAGAPTGDPSGNAAIQPTGATREVTGSVALSDNSASTSLIKAATKALTANGCMADTVMATDTKGGVSTAEVADDCSFSLTLSIGKSYVISFLMNDSFVATLIFNSGISGFATSGLPLSDGSGPLDLGSITINGSAATPELNPLEQCDQDGDGVDDLNDNDDNADGITDDEESDCDLDGIRDDVDDDTSTCSDNQDPNQVSVLAVKPYDDPDGVSPVDLQREVKARIDCDIDPSSVTSTTFSIYSEDGSDTIDCTYSFATVGNRIECDHDDQDFLPDTVYMAVIDGVLCQDGRSVESLSWSWLTEFADDNQGCYEDNYDAQNDDGQN